MRRTALGSATPASDRDYLVQDQRRAPRLIGRCLHCIERWWLNLGATFKRRRNSFRLCLYFAAQGIVWFLVGVFAIALYRVIWTAYQNMPYKECDSDVLPSPVTDATLRSYSSHFESGFVCEGEDAITGACDLFGVRSIVDPIIVSAVLMLLQWLVCTILAFAFLLFANKKVEKLQHSEATCMVKLWGGAAKHGPLLVRILHACQLGVLFYMALLLLGFQRCTGDVSKTFNCVNFQKDCTYNKMKNCAYFHKYCTDDIKLQAKAVECFNAETNAPFSGRLDVRLVTHMHCVRCQLLAEDRNNTRDEDEFRLPGVGPTPFTSHIWSTLVCECGEDLRDVLPPEEFAKYNGACAKDRRLSSRTLGEDIVTTDPGLQGDDCCGPDCAFICNEFDDTICGAGEDADLCDQGCFWANKFHKEFFFSRSQCWQTGSFVWRMCIVYTYVASATWIIVTFFGQLVRLLSRPEPWFFNPRPARERICWKLLRLLGP